MARLVWSHPNTLTANRTVRLNTGKERADLARQTRTRGGSAETEQNELAVNPQGRPVSSYVVTMVTPEGNRAIASLNAAWSTAALVSQR
jgi:hypothetical protein